jgi:hypothetical protein
MAARIRRGEPPKGKLNNKNYRRRALPALLRDFERRCAYSLRHEQQAGGLTHMEVDHFNPTLPNRSRNRYSNLFLSTRHCNLKKRAYWPLPADQKKGIRFLNCCEEIDYGVHLFEKPDTHELVALTPAGRYHIIACDLNADHLVTERRERSLLRNLLNGTVAIVKPTANLASLRTNLKLLKSIVDRMIPPIPYFG